MTNRNKNDLLPRILEKFQKPEPQWFRGLLLTMLMIFPLTFIFVHLYTTVPDEFLIKFGPLFVVSIVINIAFYSFYYIGLAKYIRNSLMTKEEYNAISIVGIMVKEKYRETSMLLSDILVGTLISSLAMYWISGILPNQIIFISLSTCILLAVHYASFLYRVRVGLYGSNVREAREILKFIEKHSEHIDTSGKGDGYKRIHVMIQGRADVGISPETIGKGLNNA